MSFNKIIYVFRSLVSRYQVFKMWTMRIAIRSCSRIIQIFLLCVRVLKEAPLFLKKILMNDLKYLVDLKSRCTCFLFTGTGKIFSAKKWSLLIFIPSLLISWPRNFILFLRNEHFERFTFRFANRNLSKTFFNLSRWSSTVSLNIIISPM